MIVPWILSSVADAYHIFSSTPERASSPNSLGERCSRRQHMGSPFSITITTDGWTWPSRRRAPPASPFGAIITAEASIKFHSPKQTRSEEHTSELQSLRHLVCRLLLE